MLATLLSATIASVSDPDPATRARVEARLLVDVDQVVRDRDGNLLAQGAVTNRERLVARFDIVEPTADDGD